MVTLEKFAKINSCSELLSKVMILKEKPLNRLLIIKKKKETLSKKALLFFNSKG
jgi:hypothetical protein